MLNGEGADEDHEYILLVMTKPVGFLFYLAFIDFSYHIVWEVKTCIENRLQLEEKK